MDELAGGTTPVAVAAPPSNGSRPLLTRDDILAAQDLTYEVVDVPEWGGAVRVQSLTGSARDTLEARFTDSRGTMDPAKAGDFRAAYVALCLVDEDGLFLFSEKDIKALGQKSSRALQRVFDVAARLSAVRSEDLDGIVSDLKADPSDDTGSD